VHRVASRAVRTAAERVAHPADPVAWGHTLDFLTWETDPWELMDPRPGQPGRGFEARCPARYRQWPLADTPWALPRAGIKQAFGLNAALR
jgi:hypothetical protein